MTNRRRFIRKDDTKRLAPPIVLLLVLAAALASYLPSYRYDADRHEGFVWDDDDHFLHDPLIRADDGWWRIWLDPMPGIVGAAGGAVVWNYQPVTRTSFWVDRHLWGADANGTPNLVAARVTNVVLHALNAFLLFVVLRQLRMPGATAAALLFAVHPLAVESVAWITERKTVLPTALFLVSLAGWLRFAASGRARWYVFTSASFLFAVLAKASTVMFPVVLALLHWYERRPWTRRAVLRLAPLFATSLVAALTTIAFERYVIGSQGEAFSASLGERVATAGRIAWFYLGKSVLPVDLSFNYPRWRVDAAAPASYLPAAAIVLVAALLWRFREGWARPWILALGCFLANLFPVLGFFDFYGMRYAHVADHWAYLASLSVVALAAGLGASLPERVERTRPRLAPAVRAAAIAAGCLVFTAFGALTWRQSSAYVDRSTLWRHTLDRQPGSYLANNNLGVLLLERGAYEQAVAHFQSAVAAEPSFPEARVNLGNALDASGRTPEAIPHWRRALELDPRQSVALHNLAVADINAGRLGEAEALARRAHEFDPRDPLALRALQHVFARQGRPSAIDEFVARAQRPPETDRVRRGRTVVAAVWAALALALGGVVLVARSER